MKVLARKKKEVFGEHLTWPYGLSESSWSFKVIDLTLFSIDDMIAKLNEINPANWPHSKPFPK